MMYRATAVQKLTEEYGKFKGDRYQEVMKSAVFEALVTFCENDEFAQAVVQGGSFADCMKAVSKNIKSSLSDLEAYRRAAAFYFDGAEVKMTLTIQLEPAQVESHDIVIDLADCL